MSDLLNQASLVMVPSGYKEDVVYSQIPTDGAGDLSFTRASNGTRINSAGLVEVTPWNIVQQSETFDNAYWAKYQCTITANNTIAPNGTTTAEKVIATANSAAVVYISSTDYISGVYNWSVYAKAGNQDKVYLEAYGVGGTACSTNINLSTQTIISQTNFTNVTIESVGNAWYRISGCLSNLGGSIVTIGFGMATSVSTNDFAYFWGAQLNIGSTAKPYFPTTDRLNVPRLTYQNGGGGCPSLLLEKQSTNLVTYSEQFDNAVWNTSNITITANDIISPDGTQNADKIILNSGTATKALFQIISLNGTYSLSWFMKYGTHRYAQILIGSDSDPFANFDLQNGVLGSSANCTPKIENYGNGWYRCTMSFTTAFGAAIDIFAIDSATATRAASTSSTGYFYAWGAQLEASSYPTSYIPTTSASATRVADACYKTGISSLIGQTEGTLFVDFNWEQKSGVFFVNSISDGTINNDISISFGNTADNRLRFFIISGGSDSVFFDSATLASGRYKVAFAYANNDAVAYINGVQQFTDSSVVVPATSAFKFLRANDTLGFNGTINQQLLFKTRLTNSELASLTTL
jgi:hypothetical protein